MYILHLYTYIYMQEKCPKIVVEQISTIISNILELIKQVGFSEAIFPK